MSDFRGARGSNTGDDFHELWAARHALRLLDDRDPLEAFTVEGIAPKDEAGSEQATWDGVDCALYEGGRSAQDADRIVLEQLKYSAANPQGTWTVARISAGETRDDTVLHRLAKAWAGIQALEPKGKVDVVLVTNQPIAAALEAATAILAKGGTTVPRARPGKDAADAAKLAFAAGLSKRVLPAFSVALSFNGGAGSRFAIEEHLLAEMTGWVDLEVQTAVAELRQFIRQRMRPEFSGELITKESVLLGLGVASMGALFPCPAALKHIAEPIWRASVADAATKILAGNQRVCLHGPGGIGKTTALQQIEAVLPAHSVVVTFDCYGSGTYMDAATLRHRPVDAFLQLSNELATRLRLPILLGRHQLSDPARFFWNRLRHAARAHAAEYPDALIVIAVDAADNAVTAAANRKPAEPCFVSDFAALGDLPPNVRFVVTARTGRLPDIALPSSYHLVPITPFTRAETEAHVRRTWDAPADWIDTFHKLSRGVPRVQSYAMDLGDAPPDHAIERLLPGGRSLDEVFREQFERALGKSGNAGDVAKFCAGLIALARPVPLADLCGIIKIPVPALIDICCDMAPAIRLNDETVVFADEDFEHFVRDAAAAALIDVTRDTASWLLERCDIDSYAAQHVASALAAAELGSELLDLVEREPSPAVIGDPVIRREAELTRLRLAISFCRKAGDAARAMRFVLIGGEGLKTEGVLRALLADNPDLAVRFAPDTASRLILTDPDQIAFHGAFLIHKQVMDASNGDRISLLEGQRLIDAWMAARQERMSESRHRDWRLDASEVAAHFETVLRNAGAEPALQSLWCWNPKQVWLQVARLTIPRLLAQDGPDLLQAVLDTGKLRPWEELLLLVPLAISGADVDAARLAKGLEGLCKGWLRRSRSLRWRNSSQELLTWLTDQAMTACELLAADLPSAGAVDDFLCMVLRSSNRRLDTLSSRETDRLDLLFRAHALRTARAGEPIDAAGLFEPRPQPAENGERRRSGYDEAEADRKLNAVATLLFPVYAATAAGLVGRHTSEELGRMLADATQQRETNSWRLARDFDVSALAMAAARGMLLLVGRGLDAEQVLAMARRVHGRWGTADSTPDQMFAQRMGLRPEWHASLVSDIDKASSEIRAQRIGAHDKSTALLTYSRLLLPISPDDANAVFHHAVEAASQLDREVLAQLRLLSLLFERGIAEVDDNRSAARELSEALADAAIRLDGEPEMPWAEVLGTVARLDLSLALANTAKWHDAGLVDFQQSLAPVLKVGLATGQLDPAAAMALEILLQGNHQVTDAALDYVSRDVKLEPFLEEAAKDALVRQDQGRSEGLVKRGIGAGSGGRWRTALAERWAFLAAMEETNSGPGAPADEESPARRVRPTWSRETLLDAEALARTLKSVQKAARAKDDYVSMSELLDGAADSVVMRDRVNFLGMLRGLQLGVSAGVVEKLLHLLETWDSPAVRRWATSELPDVIVARLPDFVRYIAHGQTSLPKALDLTGLAPPAIVDLLLRGIEQHGQMLAAEQIFPLAGLIAGHLHPLSAAGTGAWYAHRLAGRVAAEDRDQIWRPEELAQSVPVAVARFLYACMADHDVRVRWRAAHAVRRLASLEATDHLKALINEYGRRDEAIYRSPHFDFYWLAARLWFVIAWDRIAGELPQLGGLAGPLLLSIALDQAFPHLLIVSFARDACLKLVAAGKLSLDSIELIQLEGVGRSSLEPIDATEGRARGRRRGTTESTRRFHFDPMDTIPYWYDPVLDGFAEVTQDQLLNTAETWIVDRWGYPEDIREHEAGRPRKRVSDRDWSLATNDHGSTPTLERLSTHLEWHALWCAVGELLQTEPLAVRDESDWSSHGHRLARQLLTQPPMWSADLLSPVPLRPDFWQKPGEQLIDWVELVSESRLREELTPADRSGYLLVGGEWRLATADRFETVAIASALVQAELAGSLVRALQTMESTWNYHIPSESDDPSDPEQGLYQMIPWLSRPAADNGIDGHDPLRGNASGVSWMPSRWMLGECDLQQETAEGVAWTVPGQPAMFRYEVWGERERDEDNYRPSMTISGCRLLTEAIQLKEFLQCRGLELVIEVEVKREGRSNRRSYDSEDQNPEATYARIYRLDGNGRLHTAEGCIGTWPGHRPTT